jgi:hypothetical protein
VTLSTGLLARGEITEILFGHPAFELRSWLQAQTPAERLRWVQDRFEEGSSRAVITDLVFSDLEAVEETLWIGYVLQLPGAARRVGDKTIWHPDVFPREGKRAFGEKARRRPIEYKYPMRWERIVEAQVPEGWFADDLPAPISVRNALGRYESKIMVDESLVRFESTQSIDSVFVPVQEYSLVQELDQARYDAQRRGILFGTP